MRRGFIALILLASATCGGSQKPVKWDCPSGEPLLETLTINAGLAPGVVPKATPRTEPFAKEMSKLRDKGLVCIQEVWTPEARKLVLDELNLPEENVLYEDTGGENEMPGKYVCTKSEMDPVYACVKDKCADVPDEESAICALSRCKYPLFKLYTNANNCLHCLVSQAGKSADDAYDTCTSSAGARMAYGGQNGTILVSRWPLKNKEVIRLPSSGANRVGLLARVEIPGHEPIEVACTHLSTETFLDPFLPQFDKWEDEMLEQVRLITDRLAMRAGSRPQIFLGDMNAGPGRGGFGFEGWPRTHRGVHVTEQARYVWASLMRRKFKSPAASAKPIFCSTCADNSLRSSKTNYLIDHVLYRDPKGGTELEPVCAKPFLDEKYPIMDYDGRIIDSHLADHYGVEVKFRLRKTPK